MIDITQNILDCLHIAVVPQFEAPLPQIMQVISIINAELQKIEGLIIQNGPAFIGDRINSEFVMSSSKATEFEVMVSQRFKQLLSQLDQINDFLQNASNPSSKSMSMEQQIAQDIMFSQSGYLLRLWEGMVRVTRYKILQQTKVFGSLRQQRQQIFQLPKVIVKSKPKATDEQATQQIAIQQNDYFDLNQQSFQQQSVIADLVHEREQVLYAQRNTHEIQDMMNIFSQTLQMQTQQINRIYYTTIHSEDNLDIANKHLKRAKTNLKSATKETVILLVLSIFGIWYLDLSRR